MPDHEVYTRRHRLQAHEKIHEPSYRLSNTRNRFRRASGAVVRASSDGEISTKANGERLEGELAVFAQSSLGTGNPASFSLRTNDRG